MLKTIVILSVTLLLASCTPQHIQDHLTKAEINIVKFTEGMDVYRHGYDNMDRGHHEFDGDQIVVDPNYFKTNSIQRGEIIYYRNPKLTDSQLNLSEFEISRVVGLPGERIRIDKGQVYINGKVLDTFYGHANRLGMDISQLEAAAKQAQLSENLRNNFVGTARYFRENELTNVKELKIPIEHYYLIGDDWLRSADSRTFGTISKKEILGKAMGILQ